ncbi:MAG: Asp-tRNA(Asn)/Glu-tRNA(Gln) amidotransferase subunit GatB, partial [Deltaproteobacteria bacterium]|nr:Asp-tRNA(Asn)/Glu-tRNA(Gln) amidotransferase subunit GatB [Deltaproteobacteria bacterium]
PGALPIANHAAVEMAIKTGLALGCDIQPTSVFARKNYFYPDLTKGYQISQYEFPLCRGGALDVNINGRTQRISISRIQLEEDAGKLTHDYGHAAYSHVDFNRCGVPLIEIISGPDIRSAAEAVDYLQRLRAILIALDVCDGNMQEGNFRCDVNVSIRPQGQKEFGTRTEAKNLNSFRAVERTIQYEIQRQTEVLTKGQAVIQETRLWDDASGTTRGMRSKEEAHDYRYFPDPDLLPVTVAPDWIARVRTTLPELPVAKAARFVAQYGLPNYDADVLTTDRDLAQYYEACVKTGGDPKKVSNWIMTELLRELKQDDVEIGRCRITPQHLTDLLHLIEEGTISGKIAKDLFLEMYRTGADPRTLVREKGLTQVSDTGELEKIVDQVIAASPKEVEKYRAGQMGVLGHFVGQVMKATKGKANPNVVNDLLKKKL